MSLGGQENPAPFVEESDFLTQLWPGSHSLKEQVLLCRHAQNEVDEQLPDLCTSVNPSLEISTPAPIMIVSRAAAYKDARYREFPLGLLHTRLYV